MSASKYLFAAAVVIVIVASSVLSGCPKPEAPGTEVGPGNATDDSGAAGGSGGAASLSIQSKGSDTLLQVAQALAEAYKATKPGADIAVTGGGSGTGFQALIEGTTDIANASRKIKDKELEQAKSKGVEPQENIVGYDGIAVVVNKNNPVNELTIDQLSDIYTGAITDWKAVGGKGEIVLLSRDTTSGTFEYFKEAVVMKGQESSSLDYADSIVMLLSNSAIRDQVAESESAIGYIGLGFLDDSVKTIAVIGGSGAAVTPSIDTVKDESYPIARPLFMYTSQNPSEAVKAYMEWILGDDGQKIVANEGFVPVK